MNQELEKAAEAFMKQSDLMNDYRPLVTAAIEFGANWQRQQEAEGPKRQLCPKCNGSGEMYINELYRNKTSGRVGYVTCDVCGGAKILATPVLHQPPQS